MRTIEYTHHNYPGSSLVDDIYYNANLNELVVDLNDRLYMYSNVPLSAFEDFADASSAGNHYNTVFKRAYGPSYSLGDYEDFDFEPVDHIVEMPVSRNRAGSGSRPDSDYYTEPQRLVPGHDGWGSVETVGTPKDLKVTENTVIHNHYSLSEPVEDATVRNHTVVFTSNGVERTHTLKADSVDDAVGQVNEIAAMLDLTFVIKSVTTHFE